MHRLKANISRRLHRSRHKEPAADNQSMSPDCKLSDTIEPAKELSQKRSTSASGEVLITNKNQHEEAVPRNLREKRRSLSVSDTRREVSSVIGDDKTPDSSLPDYSKELNGDKKVPRNLWKDSFDKLSQKTQGHLRELGYEPRFDTKQEGDLDVLLKDLQEKREFRDKEAWKFKNDHLVRDYAATCATWVKRIGDLVVPFAPSQAAGPWGLIKAALEIPVNLAAKMTALLGAVERILQAAYRGRLYESAYATENAKEKELADTAQACSAAQGQKAIQHLQDIQGHLPRIEGQVVECLKELKDREAREILEWVSTVKYRAHHNSVRNNRTLGTGEWLLQKDAFRDWEESNSSAVLWLRGSHEGFAYFYCNRFEDIRTRPLAVAQSYVRQLASSAKETSSNQAYSKYIQSILESTYEDLRMDCADLDLKYCRELMSKYLNIYPRTTLVLDAFDECDPASRGDLLELFTDLLCNSTRPIKLFIASRPDGDVQQQVRSHPNIEIQATDNQQDIQAYINQEMLKLIKRDSAFCDLQDRIKSTLSAKSQGISFLEEIEESHPHDRDLALRAFKWVLAAREPLAREALLEAIRINPDGMDTKLCASISDDALLALCRNLLVIDSERDVWRVSHLSVVEYFELRKSWTPAVTNLMVGKACLLFMLSEAWNETTHKFPLYNLEKTPEYSCFTRTFIYYVSCFWPEHIAILDPTGLSTENLSPVVELLERFLGAPQDSSAQNRIWARWYDNSVMPSEYSILAVCIFGFRQVSDSWWNNGELDLASTNHHGRTYVLLAAEYGHIHILRILLAKGGTVGIQGGLKSTPLIKAAEYGHVEVARFLLKDAKADVNSQIDGVFWPSRCALGAAISERSLDMLQLLIFEDHAEVNMHLKCDGSPLAMASRDDWLEGTKFLVEQGGADVDLVLQYGWCGSALDAAARTNSLNTLKYLVGVQRANVNLPLQIGDYGSALAAAVMKGYPESVQYLIEVGNADVNVPLSGENGTVLTMVVMNWRLGLMETRLLIQLAMRGQPGAPRRFWFPLRDIVRALLAAGASVVSDIGDGVIVDAIECFKSETWLRKRPGIMIDAGCSLTDAFGKKRLIFDEDGAKDSLDMKKTRAVGKATLVELQTAMWQQYKNGTLGIEEARYVERMYREDNILKLSKRDLDTISTYFDKGVII
ncbi:ankyrin repeat domain-containing protein [Aspergillus neoniger CBS 115656]|uniref:Nephrocystin 3-like N-terminal domain-containing protein n=1 Tax=Aspergillus neoniger (strain CBS 115656) TaxID=1448310 RepID=A0A318YVA0_ASPNB|nr:hypothetical protein BO87DRAFT_382708 [Aspergillus neoniger CBS 115656]PYH38721.1 hypothetical protein BO87DRAFT_382708 [Aspergillus neoniger CBS 115656]